MWTWPLPFSAHCRSTACESMGWSTRPFPRHWSKMSGVTNVRAQLNVGRELWCCGDGGKELLTTIVVEMSLLRLIKAMSLVVTQRKAPALLYLLKPATAILMSNTKLQALAQCRWRKGAADENQRKTLLRHTNPSVYGCIADRHATQGGHTPFLNKPATSSLCAVQEASFGAAQMMPRSC